MKASKRTYKLQAGRPGRQVTGVSRKLLVLLMLSFSMLLTSIQPSWSSEWNEWNEGWRKIEHPDMPEKYLLAAPWDWGRTVLTGAMAEHEELETIKPRMASIEEQLDEVITYINKSNIQIEEKINQAISQSYWKGFRHGGGLGTLIGIGLGIWIAD